MNIILFGATGMVGQGVLREALLDPEITSVLAIVRSSTGQAHPKLREIIHRDYADYSAIEAELSGLDACCFCLGISSAGMNEADYTRVTYDYALAAAQVLVKHNPRMTFIYVSGASTDSSEQGSVMWARVKGKAENALLALPFAAAYMFRPAIIQPLHGIVSKTLLYRVLYVLLTPLYPLVRMLAPKLVTTSERVGRAMLHVAKHGADKRVLENDDINQLGAALLAG